MIIRDYASFIEMIRTHKGRSFAYDVEDLRRLAHVPIGMCECGCGLPTGTYPRTNRTQGAIKGAPKRVIPGHANRTNPFIHILNNISVDGVTGCWHWTGSVFSESQRPRWTLGQREPDKEVLAYRAVYRLMVGDIPEGFYVCHSCDNPSCVSPNHLWLGTARDNSQDASQKGRLPTGASNRDSQGTNVKLNVEMVRQIRKSSDSTKALASRFGVSPSTVTLVRQRKTWKDVDAD